MNIKIPTGVWPTMLTPFTESNEVDYDALFNLVEWYIEKEVDGLFAVCLSSEMYHLTLEERVNIAKFIKKCTKDRIPVVASGHISDQVEEQIYELKAMADTGIDALIFVANRFATKHEDDDAWKINAEKMIEAIPDIPLGIYECPYPYHRTMTPELLKWCTSTGRFLFLKDTCCDLMKLKTKLDVVKGSNLKIFNANSATLLTSLKMGASGFCGVMANFHPDLYVWLIQNWKSNLSKATILQNFLALSSLIETQYYPVNGKYHMQLCGIRINLNTRSKDVKGFTPLHRLQVRQLQEFETEIRKILDIN